MLHAADFTPNSTIFSRRRKDKTAWLRVSVLNGVCQHAVHGMLVTVVVTHHCSSAFVAPYDRVIYRYCSLADHTELSTALSWLGLCQPEDHELIKVQYTVALSYMSTPVHVNPCACQPLCMSTPVHVNPCACQPLYMSTPVHVNPCTCQPLYLSTPVPVNPCTCQPLYMSTPVPVNPCTCQPQYLSTPVPVTHLSPVNPCTCHPPVTCQPTCHLCLYPTCTQGTTNPERQLGFLVTFLELVLIAYNLEDPFTDDSRYTSRHWASNVLLPHARVRVVYWL